ncbi:MAG: acetolactate synthase small subunit [Deltaproteobacteria bacterium]|jgi:acetolactate synthase-1/3 small subunit|nr:acetolactate synthase small subunit [Deltaproteobacteria bacterium]
MADRAQMRKIISILVRNKPGVLSHVAGLVTRRAYNVESIAAGPTEDNSITRITLVVSGDEQVLEQVTKQFRKLIDVIKVDDIPHELAMTGELALITVAFDPSRKSEIMNLVNVLGMSVQSIGLDSITLQVAGSAQRVDTAINGLYPFEIRAMARTGLVALPVTPAGAQ